MAQSGIFVIKSISETKEQIREVMLPIRINNQPLLLRRLEPGDIGLLCEYLADLGEATRKRFGPHPADRKSLEEIYGNRDDILGYIALNIDSGAIIAYSVIKKGYLEHDAFRFRSYGLEPDPFTDCTFAPSVADNWQGYGLGSALFLFMLDDLVMKGFKRIILWGGVQCNNLPALNYYRKFGFVIPGEFEYYGMNYDMIRILE